MHYFVQYERISGNLVGYFSASNKEFLPKPPSAEHDQVEITEARDIELMRSVSPQCGRLQGRFVDGKLSGLTFVALPQLRVTVEKDRLNGDGSDTTAIEVQAVDAAGRPVRDLDDEIRVTTQRGKLSELGGLVKLVRGRAKLELTSVDETVHRVRVRAVSLRGRAAAGETVVEFA